jgi:hypothetical protein
MKSHTGSPTTPFLFSSFNCPFYIFVEFGFEVQLSKSSSPPLILLNYSHEKFAPWTDVTGTTCTSNYSSLLIQTSGHKILKHQQGKDQQNN